MIITSQKQVDIPDKRAFVSTKRHSKVDADLLLERFGIDIHLASATLNFIDQIGMRSEVLPLARRYKAD